MFAIVAITKRGKDLAEKLGNGLRQKNKIFFPAKGALKNLTREIFAKDKFEGIIFIMASGIVIRLIAGLLKDKYNDPAVVVVDEAGRFAISLVSGHEGGANRLAVEAGNILSAEPVITTASETAKNLIVGIGCRRGVEKKEVMGAIKRALTGIKCRIDEVRCVSTVDLKQNEPGLKEACAELGIPLKIISSDLIKRFNGVYNRSSLVQRKIGIGGVCEPCALLSAKRAKLVMPKKILGRVTVAAVKES